MMLFVVVFIIVFFVFGVGVDGGLLGVFGKFGDFDFNLIGVFNILMLFYYLWWFIVLVLFVYILFGLLLYIGNKFWVLCDDCDCYCFVKFVFGVGLMFGLFGFGGLLLCVVFGDVFLVEGCSVNEVLFVFFIEFFLVWFVVFVGVGILVVIMLMVDGFVVLSL